PPRRGQRRVALITRDFDRGEIHQRTRGASGRQGVRAVECQGAAQQPRAAIVLSHRVRVNAFVQEVACRLPPRHRGHEATAEQEYDEQAVHGDDPPGGGAGTTPKSAAVSALSPYFSQTLQRLVLS